MNTEVIPLKRVSQHSKPFWTPKLTRLSYAVQEARKKMCRRSTPDNIETYKKAKQEFSNNLIAEKNNWIKTKLENLNVNESQKFWKNYKKSIVGEEIQYLGNLERWSFIYRNKRKRKNPF